MSMKHTEVDNETESTGTLVREFFEVKNSLIGLISLINPFAIYDSSPRLAMLHNHIRQAPPVLNPDIPLILNGNETQLVAYDIRMPEDGVVISVHRKYRKTLDSSNVKHNPLTTIIYQNFHTHEFDCVHIYEFNTNHKTYGSRYIQQPIVANLHEGMFIKKDTLFARSPSKLEGDIYSTSVTCNILAVGSPDTIEDGFCVSDEFCERAGLLELKSITRSWGKFKYLLNTHSKDPKVFKGLLDIGDVVGADGILMAFRTKNPLFDALDVTNEALMEIDHDHDTKVHCEPGFTVYDITIESGNGETTSKPTSPKNIAEQAERYISSLSLYYSSLLESHDKLSKDAYGRINTNVIFSPRLTQLLTRAIADKPNAPANKVVAGGRVRRARKKEKLDEYTVTIKLYKPKPLGMGAKLTDLNAGKGVICNKRPRSEMPRDEAGNVADLIYYYKAGVARLNTGGLVEGFIGACIRDITHEIKDVYNGLPITGSWNKKHQDVWNRLVSFYEQTSPLSFEWSQSPEITNGDRINHLNVIIETTVRIMFPLDNPKNTIDIIDNIGTVIKPTFGTIYFTDFLGREVPLKMKGMIQTKQIIVLEKTKLDPMAVSGAIRQIHGLPSGANKNTRDAKAYKVHALRNLSETEVRFLAALWGGELLAQYMALTSDPDAHKRLVKEILESENPMKLRDVPSDIEMSRAVKLVKDVLLNYGIEIVSSKQHNG